MNDTTRHPDSDGGAGPAEVVLSAEGIHAGYGKREILHGVSLSVRHGEIVALIGLNGAGKSTLLKVLAGLLEARAGRVIFQGEDITRLAAHRRALAGVAYVMQGGAVFPSLTAADHLLLGGRVARGAGRPAGPRVYEGILPLADAARAERAGLFSGGQRQALAVATMLATGPGVLLCDEPSAGLAPNLARALIERIARVARQSNLAVLWVEQRLGDVLAVADRAVLLHRGAVGAETDRPTDWLVPDVLARLTLGTSWGAA